MVRWREAWSTAVPAAALASGAEAEDDDTAGSAVVVAQPDAATRRRSIPLNGDGIRDGLGIGLWVWASGLGLGLGLGPKPKPIAQSQTRPGIWSAQRVAMATTGRDREELALVGTALIAATGLAIL